MSAELSRLLGTPWTKNIEDQTDAFYCALIGYGTGYTADGARNCWATWRRDSFSCRNLERAPAE